MNTDMDAADTDRRARELATTGWWQVYGAAMAPDQSDTYRTAVTEAIAFIESQRLDGSALWRANDEPNGRSSYSYYHGAAGVILSFAELSATPGNEWLLERAVQAGDEVLAYLADDPALSVNESDGLAGYAFVLNELGRVSGQERFVDEAARCIGRIAAQATDIGAGIGWIEPMPFSQLTGFTGDRELWDVDNGAAGVLLAFLYAADHGLRGDALALAERTAERLLEVGVPTDDGIRWQMMPDIPWPFTTPNFAHGGAGVGFALLQLYRHNGDERLLKAGRQAESHVMARSFPVGDSGGRLVCHTEEHVDPPMFYLGVCHGPAGTGRLLLELADLTGEQRYLDDLAVLIDGVEAIGAPEHRSDGFWNNHSQCCGDAGLGEFASFAAQRTGDDRFIGLAERCAKVILDASEVSEGTRRWRFAEHRLAPEHLRAQTGYMQGAAGLASFLNNLADTIDGEARKIWPLDWPALRP